MRILLFSMMLLLISELSFGIQVWQYKATKNGITMIADGGYEDSIGNQRMYDAFLDLLAEKTKGRLRGYKILLILDGGLLLSTYEYWSATMAFDTLRDLDNEFIKAYARFRENGSSKVDLDNRELPSDNNMYVLPEPIDINSSFDTTTREVGLKIIYNYGENDSLTTFDRILTLVNYGIKNIDKIKNEQKRIILNYQGVKIKLSMLTIDTGFFKSLPVIKSGFDHHIYSSFKRNSATKEMIRYLVVGISLILLLVIIYLKKLGLK